MKLARSGAKVLARRTVRSGDARCLSPADYPHPWESRVSSGPGGIVYHETFSDPKSGWPESHDPNGDAHYAPGGYRLSRAVRLRDTPFPAVAGEAANAGDCIIAAYGPWWTNFRATARIEAQPDLWWRNRREASGRRDPWWGNTREPGAPDDTASGVGLVFNLMETGYYALILTPEARVALIKGKWDGTRSVLVHPASADPTPLDQQSAHTLSVECVRGRIALNVDGRAVAPVDDSSFPYGLVGFGVFGGGRLLVRDLTVEAVRQAPETTLR